MNPDLTCSFTHGSHRFFKFYRLLLQDHGKCLTPRAEPGPLGSENHGRRGRYPRQVRRTAEFLSDHKHTSAAGPALIERGLVSARPRRARPKTPWSRRTLAWPCAVAYMPEARTVPGLFSEPVTATRPPPEPSAAVPGAASPSSCTSRGTGRTVCSTADGFRLSTRTYRYGTGAVPEGQRFGILLP